MLYLAPTGVHAYTLDPFLTLAMGKPPILDRAQLGTSSTIYHVWVLRYLPCYE